MASKPKTMELPPKLATLYTFLDGKGDTDITDIYAAVIGGTQLPQRDAQQFLGPYITRLNRRLREHYRAVRPGRIKGTYTLVDL